MVDYQIVLLLITNTMFSASVNIQIRKSLVFHNHQSSLQQGKCHSVKNRLIKVNLKSEISFCWLQRERKLLSSLQNQNYSESSLHWNNHSAVTHLHYLQAVSLSPVYNILHHDLCAKVTVDTIAGMHGRWVISLLHGSWWILKVCLYKPEA